MAHETREPKTHTLPKQVTIEMFQGLVDKIAELEAKINAQPVARQTATREMTDADAMNVLTGELKDVKHNDAAAKLGLSYGQVYSCRLGYTFKHVHKELNTKGFKNTWIKA